MTTGGWAKYNIKSTAVHYSTNLTQPFIDWHFSWLAAILKSLSISLGSISFQSHFLESSYPPLPASFTDSCQTTPSPPQNNWEAYIDRQIDHTKSYQTTSQKVTEPVSLSSLFEFQNLSDCVHFMTQLEQIVNAVIVVKQMKCISYWVRRDDKIRK